MCNSCKLSKRSLYLPGREYVYVPSRFGSGNMNQIVEQSPSGEADFHAFHGTLQSSPLGPLPSQRNPIQAIPSCLFSHVSIIIPSTYRSSKWALSFRFPQQIPVCICVRTLSSPYVPHALPISFSFIYRPGNILSGVQIQIVYLLIM